MQDNQILTSRNWLLGFDSNLFTGGLIVMVITFVITSLSQFWQFALERVKGRLLVSIEIKSSDRSYPILQRWLAQQLSESTPSLTVQTDEAGSEPQSFTYVPASGSHFLSYRGVWILVQHSVDPNKSIVDFREKESYVLSTYGSIQTLKDLMLDAQALQAARDSNLTSIYAFSSRMFNWEVIAAKPRRHLDSVVLVDGMMERAVNDLSKFLARKQWYEDRGLNYRRGYVLSCFFVLRPVGRQ